MSNMRVIITEKKDVADSMAAAMGWRSANGGYEGTFEGAPVRVVWARGHLLTMESPDDINPSLGWNNPTALAPIPRAVQMKIPEEPGVEENRTLAYRMKVIKSALEASDEVILATDSDREGEYIGWSILAFYNWNKPVRRCWLTEGMDTKSMTKALSNLLPASDKKSLARAAEARARCDWAYMYLVRLLSFYGRKGLLGKHLGTGEGRESVVSVGRVQSAALYMIFSREMEIRSFVPKTFFKLFGDFEAAGVMLNAEYKPKFAPSEAQMNYLAKIEAETGVKATADDMSSQAKLNAFIDKQKSVQANHLVIFDPKKREVRLSHRIPDHLEEESFRAAMAYSMTYCYKEKCKAKVAEYARKAGENLIKAGIPLLACIIGYVCFMQ